MDLIILLIGVFLPMVSVAFDAACLGDAVTIKPWSTGASSRAEDREFLSPPMTLRSVKATERLRARRGDSARVGVGRLAASRFPRSDGRPIASSVPVERSRFFWQGNMDSITGGTRPYRTPDLARVPGIRTAADRPSLDLGGLAAITAPTSAVRPPPGANASTARRLCSPVTSERLAQRQIDCINANARRIRARHVRAATTHECSARCPALRCCPTGSGHCWQPPADTLTALQITAPRVDAA